MQIYRQKEVHFNLKFTALLYFIIIYFQPGRLTFLIQFRFPLISMEPKNGNSSSGAFLLSGFTFSFYCDSWRTYLRTTTSVGRHPLKLWHSLRRTSGRVLLKTDIRIPSKRPTYLYYSVRWCTLYSLNYSLSWRCTDFRSLHYHSMPQNSTSTHIVLACASFLVYTYFIESQMFSPRAFQNLCIYPQRCAHFAELRINYHLENFNEFIFYFQRLFKGRLSMYSNKAFFN